jgi:Immunity protein family (Imm11)
MTQPTGKYFDLFCDMGAPDERWYLNGPYGPTGELLGDVLTSGRKYEGAAPVICPVGQAGAELELTMTEELVPILNERVAGIFSAHIGQDAQLIQARVKGSEAKLWAVNVLATPDCIDEARSTLVERWTAADGGNPALIGMYRKIEGLQLDPARVGNHAIFRPHGWDVAVIVSEPFAQALQKAGVRCQLKPVS